METKFKIYWALFILDIVLCVLAFCCLKFWVAIVVFLATRFILNLKPVKKYWFDAGMEYWLKVFAGK